MKKLVSIGLMLIMFILILSSISEAKDKIEYITEETVIMKVPKNKKHLIQQDIDVEFSISKARCYFDKSEGDKWLKSLWLVESSQASPDTIVIGDDGTSYGPFQIRLETIRTIDVLYDDLDLSKYTDADIAYSLILNFDFSIEMAARYIGYLESRFNVWSSAIEAYNRGPGGVRKGKRLGLPYYTKILRAYNNQEESKPYDKEICKGIISKL